MLRALLLVFFSCLLANNAKSQNEIILSQPDCMFLVEGYSTKLELSFSKRKIKNIDINCENCDTLYFLDNFFVVRPKMKAEFVQLDILSNKKDTLESFKIDVIPLKKPEVFIDGRENTTSLNTLPQELQLKSIEDYLNVKYSIKKVEVKINDRTFKSVGKSFSDEIRSYLGEVHSGEMIINLIYQSPLGYNRVILTVFKFNGL